MSRKKHKHEEHVNMERWLVSYADFVTLMFILYLILYSMSAVDAQKFEALKESLQKTNGAGASIIFDNPGSSPAPKISRETSGKDNQTQDQKKADALKKAEEEKNLQQLAKSEQDRFEALKKALEKYARDHGIEDNIALKLDKRGLNISITGTVLYENGSATLLPVAKQTIKELFGIVDNYVTDNPIQLEGHTDDRPISTAQFPTNWELSSARSVNLLRYLIEEYDIEPSRISASAYGEYHPVAPNTNADGRTKNRRVEISILSKSFIRSNQASDSAQPNNSLNEVPEPIVTEPPASH